jgi:hypothetical protein
MIPAPILDHIPPDLNTVKFPVPYPDISDRFTCLLTLILKRNAGPHRDEDVDDTGARWIYSHVPYQQVRARNNGSSYHEKRGR